MEHFTSQIQQLEKRVECAETNVVTEAERVRAELRAEQRRRENERLQLAREKEEEDLFFAKDMR